MLVPRRIYDVKRKMKKVKDFYFCLTKSSKSHGPGTRSVFSRHSTVVAKVTRSASGGNSKGQLLRFPAHVVRRILTARRGIASLLPASAKAFAATSTQLAILVKFFVEHGGDEDRR